MYRKPDKKCNNVDKDGTCLEGIANHIISPSGSCLEGYNISNSVNAYKIGNYYVSSNVLTTTYSNIRCPSGFRLPNTSELSSVWGSIYADNSSFSFLQLGGWYYSSSGGCNGDGVYAIASSDINSNWKKGQYLCVNKINNGSAYCIK